MRTFINFLKIITTIVLVLAPVFLIYFSVELDDMVYNKVSQLLELQDKQYTFNREILIRLLNASFGIGMSALLLILVIFGILLSRIGSVIEYVTAFAVALKVTDDDN